MNYYSALRSLLFRVDAEKVHHLALGFLEQPWSWWALEQLLGPAPQKEVRLWNLRFRNPVGLAAGFDKNAVALRAWQALGFGFVETGTLTPMDQPGNGMPRIHRFAGQSALVNSMGFPNEGVAQAAWRLKQFRSWARRDTGMPIGVNLGKNRVTSMEQASRDYRTVLEKSHAHGDYFVVNVSSPNTPGLRTLQGEDELRLLLKELYDCNRNLSGTEESKPLLLKIAPDLDEEQTKAIVGVVQDCGLDGIVATNTTTDHSSLALRKPLPGGLSGKPLREKSTQIIRWITQASGGKLPVIGCGGIFTRDDLLEKQDAGARLFQVYTGYVYEGPRMISSLCG